MTYQALGENWEKPRSVWQHCLSMKSWCEKNIYKALVVNSESSIDHDFKMLYVSKCPPFCICSVQVATESGWVSIKQPCSL